MSKERLSTLLIAELYERDPSLVPKGSVDAIKEQIRLVTIDANILLVNLHKIVNGEAQQSDCMPSTYNGDYSKAGICGLIALMGAKMYNTFDETDSIEIRICVAKKDLIGKILKNIFRTWPKYSGNIYYPVPGIGSGDLSSPEIAYERSIDKWSGQYGALRRELLDYALVKIKENI